MTQTIHLVSDRLTDNLPPFCLKQESPITHSYNCKGIVCGLDGNLCLYLYRFDEGYENSSQNCYRVRPGSFCNGKMKAKSDRYGFTIDHGF